MYSTSLQDSLTSVHWSYIFKTHLWPCALDALFSRQCSSTCAGGFQRRVVVCQDENGYPANSCEDRNRPSEQRSCESGPCPQWIYGNWGEVSQTPVCCCLHQITACLGSSLERKLTQKLLCMQPWKCIRNQLSLTFFMLHTRQICFQVKKIALVFFLHTQTHLLNKTSPPAVLSAPSHVEVG